MAVDVKSEKLFESVDYKAQIENLYRISLKVSGNRLSHTNMSIEHTARSGADGGYFMIVPENRSSTMNADGHDASINFALQNVSTVTTCAAVLEALGPPAPA
jgi:hypothetical protein